MDCRDAGQYAPLAHENALTPSHAEHVRTAHEALIVTKSEDLESRSANGWPCAAVFLFLLFFIPFKLIQREHRLSFVPDGLDVSGILYTNEESWGFGPGGNETGVIVYELAEDAAARIQKAGITYFTSLSPRSENRHGWHGLYAKWQRTPMLGDPQWASSGTSCDCLPVPPDPAPQALASYLGRYGFGIKIDSRIGQLVDEAISKPGSFYAYGRIGILIVIPDARRVIYAYNG